MTRARFARSLTRSLALSLALSLSALLPACREPARSVCVESLCFEWAEPHRLRSEGHKHTLSSDAWDGAWIDVQSWSPGPRAPTTPDALVEALSRLRALSGGAVSRTSQVSAFAGQPAVLEDVVLEWRGQRVRGQTWVVPRSPRWLSVDVTAREPDWNRASPRLLAYVARARWQAPAR